jgi:hypothetical protein
MLTVPNELPELSLIATRPPPPPLRFEPLVAEPPFAVILPLPEMVDALMLILPPEPRALPPFEPFAEMVPLTERVVTFRITDPPPHDAVPHSPELPRLTGLRIDP